MSIASMPTGWQGRLLALFLFIVALGGIYLLVAAPLLDLYAEREKTSEDRRMLLSRLKATTAEVPALRARVAEARAASTNMVALEGASDAIASANLQSRVAEHAAAAGVAIGSTESLPAEVRGDHRRIGVRLALNATYDTLMTLLAKLETAMPPLVIDNLQVRGLLSRPGAPPTGRVDVRLDVYGFRTRDSRGVTTP